MSIPISQSPQYIPDFPIKRDYICPCGKSYLSYPALFTHIKLKHQNQAPGLIIKPENNRRKRRGRPCLNKCDDSKQQGENKNKKNKILQELSQYMRKWTDGRTKSNLKQKYQHSKLYKQFQTFLSQQNESILITPNKQKTPISSSYIFCHFLKLIQLHPFLYSFFQQLLLLLVFLTKAWDEQNKRYEYISDDSVRYMNTFIIKYIRKFIVQAQIDKDELFNLQSVLRIYELIFSWLHELGFINIWLKTNLQYLRYI